MDTATTPDMCIPETEEQVEETVSNPTDYKVVRDMLNNLEEMHQTLHDMTVNELHNTYGVNEGILHGIGLMTDDDIQISGLADYEALYEKYKNGHSRYEVPKTDEDAVRILVELKTRQRNLYESEQNLEEVRSDSTAVLNEYLEYMTSEKAAEARKRQFEIYREACSQEQDEVKRNEMLRMITTVHSTESYSYFFDRIDALGDEEIKNLVYTFFDDRRSKYVVDKFKAKIKMFGFNPRLYHYFFDLEEHFLPERYHVYNNFFLFFYMRFVAYSQKYSKFDTVLVQSFTSAISRLVYHKYPTTDDERKMVAAMGQFLNYFSPYHELFAAQNTSWSKHPERAAYHANEESKKKESLIAMMNKKGITDYDPDATSEELMAYINAQMDRLKAVQAADKEKAATGEVDKTEPSDINEAETPAED